MCVFAFTAYLIKALDIAGLWVRYVEWALATPLLLIDLACECWSGIWTYTAVSTSRRCGSLTHHAACVALHLEPNLPTPTSQSSPASLRPLWASWPSATCSWSVASLLPMRSGRPFGS